MVTVSGKIEQYTPCSSDTQSPEILVFKHTKSLKRYSQISIPLPYLQTLDLLMFLFNLQHLALKFHLPAPRTRSKEYPIKSITVALLLILTLNGKYASHTHTHTHTHTYTHTHTHTMCHVATPRTAAYYNTSTLYHML
jgi:hypothetical protein